MPHHRALFPSVWPPDSRRCNSPINGRFPARPNRSWPLVLGPRQRTMNTQSSGDLPPLTTRGSAERRLPKQVARERKHLRSVVLEGLRVSVDVGRACPSQDPSWAFPTRRTETSRLLPLVNQSGTTLRAHAACPRVWFLDSMTMARRHFEETAASLSGAEQPAFLSASGEAHAGKNGRFSLWISFHRHTHPRGRGHWQRAPWQRVNILSCRGAIDTETRKMCTVEIGYAGGEGVVCPPSGGADGV